MKRNNQEQLHQKGVVRYLQVKYPDIRFTISPANTINPYHGKQNKEMGYMPGTPDIMIFAARKGYHGLFIEMKTPEIKDYNGKIIQKKGFLSKEQGEWGEYLTSENYLFQVCEGSQSAYEIIDLYFSKEER